jgi:hypothetical protein
VAELEDAAGLGPVGLRPLEVRVLSPAPTENPLLSGGFHLLGSRATWPEHGLNAQGLCGRSSVVDVKQHSLLLIRVRGKVAVGGVDHKEGRSHPPREREQGHACGQAPSRIRVAGVVDAPVRDSGGPERRQLAKQKTRDAATAKLPGKLEEARIAREAARDEADRALSKHRVKPEASVRVRRLLDEGVSLGEVLERAKALGDVETLAAARAEVGYLTMGGEGGARNRFAAPGELGALARAADLSLAALSSERRPLTALVELAHDRSGGVEEAGQLAMRAIEGDPNVGRSRIEFAYAAGETGDAAA